MLFKSNIKDFSPALVTSACIVHSEHDISFKNQFYEQTSNVFSIKL